jgi:hypothetical protein
MAERRIGASYLFTFTTIATAVLSAAQGAERDAPGWEAAHWGMSEPDLQKAFASQVLFPKPADQPGEMVLAMPGYVFLGCPFDVTFLLTPSQGLVRVELTQVECLVGHTGKSAGDYEAACEAIDRRLEERYGPPQERRYEKDWPLPSAEITTGGAQTGQVYISFDARLGSNRKK